MPGSSSAGLPGKKGLAVFLLEDDKGLTRARFVMEVKAALEEAGMDETK